jgi:hypothetical protein
MQNSRRIRKPNYLTKKQLFSNSKPPTGWGAALLVIFFCLLTAIIVNFLNNIHYKNKILQASNQVTAAQTLQTKEEYDLNFVISNYSGQLNCYDLHSPYAHAICNTHNSSASLR